MAAAITKTIIVVPGLSNTELPGDYNTAAARQILASTVSGLESMNVCDTVQGTTRTITFSQRTGTKG